MKLEKISVVIVTIILIIIALAILSVPAYSIYTRFVIDKHYMQDDTLT